MYMGNYVIYAHTLTHGKAPYFIASWWNSKINYECKDQNKGPVQVWKWIVCVCGNEIKKDIQIVTWYVHGELCHICSYSHTWEAPILYCYSLANEIQKYESKDKNKGLVQVWKRIICVCGNEIKKDI